MKTKGNKKIKGISLIVLVITIIVIIILASAIILTLINNNPINEANKAKFESDRDNMQSIFTNTVAKVMVQKQGNIKIKAGNINSIISGKSSIVGEVEYTIENSVNSSNITGKIIFDSKPNTETEYYTGKQLPLYKAGETIWSVDEEGILKLSVDNKDYGENGDGNNESNGSTDDGTSISKEEIEKLKENIEKINSKLTLLEDDNKAMRALIEKLDSSQLKIAGVKAGEVTLGKITSNTTKSVDVTLKEPIDNANYSVVITCATGGSMWAQTEFSVQNKTNNGFKVSANNTGSSTSASLSANYIVIPYTE